MVYKDRVGLFTEALKPCDEAVLVGVTAHTRQPAYLGLNIYLLAEELDALSSVVQCTAERADSLIADEQHEALGPPQIVL